MNSTISIAPFALVQLFGVSSALKPTQLRLISPKQSLTQLRVMAPSDAASKPPCISVEEVNKHNHADDCWIVVYFKVYDVSSFLPSHPGGPDSMIAATF